jgi:hypothetical protein
MLGRLNKVRMRRALRATDLEAAFGSIRAGKHQKPKLTLIRVKRGHDVDVLGASLGLWIAAEIAALPRLSA